MPWSADAAMRQMWSELDQNVTNGEMMQFFKRHLEDAYLSGCQDSAAYVERIGSYGS